jgi:hypothetical protein
VRVVRTAVLAIGNAIAIAVVTVVIVIVAMLWMIRL